MENLQGGKFWEVFNKPYPFNEDLKHNSKLIFFTSLGVFGFLFLFQPFDISLIPEKEKLFFIAGLAVITFLSLSFNLMIIPSLFPHIFSSARWKIKKEIVWNLWTLFTTLAGYFVLNKMTGILKFDFLQVIKMVFTAIIPISVYILFNHNKMLRSHLKLADELSKKLKENKSLPEKIIHFFSEYQKDSLAIKLNNFLFVRSANNYIEVFWKEGDVVKNQMVRNSIQNADDILKEHKLVFRCHRSYLININYIDRIEGNSQGYKLFVEGIGFAIPVSKNAVEKLKELI